jgi:hypothetical protein
MSRKTVPVADLVDRANRMLAADGSTPEGRAAIAVMVESVLLDTGNYRGFSYLPSEYLPAEEQTPGHVLRDGMDHTRRYYYGGVTA